MSELIDLKTPFMLRFFRTERVNNIKHLNRSYTLELLFQELGPDVVGQG